MKNKTKKFLYNKKFPKQTLNIFNDENPKDTISIKYKTIKDVKNTIYKLENLFKNKKYSHKRIVQVAMIMKIRLYIIFKNYKKGYVRLKKSKKYLEFLKRRTKQKGFLKRKKMKFSF